MRPVANALWQDIYGKLGKRLPSAAASVSLAAVAGSAVAGSLRFRLAPPERRADVAIWFAQGQELDLTEIAEEEEEDDSDASDADEIRERIELHEQGQSRSPPSPPSLAGAASEDESYRVTAGADISGDVSDLRDDAAEKSGVFLSFVHHAMDDTA